MFSWLLKQPQEEVLRLADAFCFLVGRYRFRPRKCDTGRSFAHEERPHTDMADWWKSTGESYLSYASNERILGVVSEAFPLKSQTLNSFKKAKLVAAAGKHPDCLRYLIISKLYKATKDVRLQTYFRVYNLKKRNFSRPGKRLRKQPTLPKVGRSDLRIHVMARGPGGQRADPDNNSHSKILSIASRAAAISRDLGQKARRANVDRSCWHRSAASNHFVDGGSDI